MADSPQSPDPKETLTGRARSLANLKPFVKGQKPPPGAGRPKGLGAQVRAEWTQEEMVKAYTEIAKGQRDGFGAQHVMEALKWLADRGFGKAPDVTLTGELDPEAGAQDLSTEDLKEMVASVRKTG